jgi:hypothetical protein
VKYFENFLHIADIKAESIIATLLEADNETEVNALGSFYRNYCDDLIEIQKSQNKATIDVKLSRDGVYHLLPEALFFLENSLLITKTNKLSNQEILQEEAIIKEIKKQNDEREELQDFFKFFDTQYLKTRINLEKEIFDIENIKTSLILEQFFDYNFENEENSYIKKIAPFLINVNQIRGDFFIIQKLLCAVLHEKVEIKRQNISFTEFNEPVTCIQFIIHTEGLSLKEYQDLNNIYNPFFCFVSDWFFPFEVECNYKIKDMRQKFVLQKPLILDYNTQLF